MKNSYTWKGEAPCPNTPMKAFYFLWTGRLKASLILLTAFLFIGTDVLAQSELPPPERCTSQDLTVVGASLTGTGCVTCELGTSTTSTLVLQIYNKTNSHRTAFSFWGNLEIRDIDGNLKSSTPINDCDDSGFPGRTTKGFNSIEITYECGDQIKLTNLYLAWTDAADIERNQCPAIENNPGGISPKCGTLAELAITTPLFATASAGNIACHGETTTLTASAVGGTAPYQYSLNGGPFQSSNTFTVDADGSPYTVTIKDSSTPNNCTAIAAPVTIDEPADDLAATAVGDDVLCKGGTTTVTVAASGGTAPYTGTGTFTVGAGTHTYTITDANDCETTASVTIGEPDDDLAASISSVTDVSCEGPNTGAIYLNVSGGTTPYTYDWDDLPGTNDPKDRIGIAAGTYSVTVTDANGCTAPTLATVAPAENCGPLTGCTIGFWKNWPKAWGCGYVPTGRDATKFFDAFNGIAGNKKQGLSGKLTMFDALSLDGGAYRKLARHAVGALLNACHQNVNYPYTQTEIKTAVASMFNNGTATIGGVTVNSAEALGDIFDRANNKNCPLNNSNYNARTSDGMSDEPSDLNNPMSVIAYPNPAREMTTIRFSSPTATKAVLQVYTLDGRQQSTLFEGEMEAGKVYEAQLDIKQSFGSMFFYKLQTDYGSKTGKVMTIRE